MENFLGIVNSLGALYAFLLLIALIGGWFAFKIGRRTGLTNFQKETIEAMQQRLDILDSQILDLTKTNTIQQHVIDTITAALKQRGMVITIDGDMVTIADQVGVTQHRKRTVTTTKGVSVKEEKED